MECMVFSNVSIQIACLPSPFTIALISALLVPQRPDLSCSRHLCQRTRPTYQPTLVEPGEIDSHLHPSCKKTPCPLVLINSHQQISSGNSHALVRYLSWIGTHVPRTPTGLNAHMSRALSCKPRNTSLLPRLDHGAIPHQHGAIHQRI